MLDRCDYEEIPYKYRTTENLTFQTGLRPMVNIHTDYVTLLTDGKLIIARGYAWDGPSGPTIDTAGTMEGALVHDALYQLIREMRLPMVWREKADTELRKRMIADGAGRFRAWYFYLSVRKFGRRYADPASAESNNSPK